MKLRHYRSRSLKLAAKATTTTSQTTMATTPATTAPWFFNCALIEGSDSLLKVIKNLEFFEN